VRASCFVYAGRRDAGPHGITTADRLATSAVGVARAKAAQAGLRHRLQLPPHKSGSSFGRWSPYLQIPPRQGPLHSLKGMVPEASAHVPVVVCGRCVGGSAAQRRSSTAASACMRRWQLEFDLIDRIRSWTWCRSPFAALVTCRRGSARTAENICTARIIILENGSSVKNAHAQHVATRSKPPRLRQASLHLRLKDSTGLSARTHPRLLISTELLLRLPRTPSARPRLSLRQSRTHGSTLWHFRFSQVPR
jgi:hypothetical protein